MLPIPSKVSAKFNELLRKRGVNDSLHVHYRKWLLYFLDFCKKYSPPKTESEQVRLIVEKLKSKKQTQQQFTQAAHAISRFFESQKLRNGAYPVTSEAKSAPPIRPVRRQPEAHIANSNAGEIISCPVQPVAAIAEPSPSCSQPEGKRFNEWRCLEKTKSAAWDQIIERLAGEIKVRHYSRKTLKTYADWGRKFQRYLRDKFPEELTAIDVKQYLTYLAVEGRVAASTGL